MWRSAVQVCLGLHGKTNAAGTPDSDTQKHPRHPSAVKMKGGLAQLARALAWHARGHRFDPDILHPVLNGLRKTIYDILYNTTNRLSSFKSGFRLWTLMEKEVITR